jgi:hypothetical protein
MSNHIVYFGRYDGSIRRIEGTLDNTKSIVISVKQAYNNFGSLSYKQFKWAKFLVKSEAPVLLSSKLSVDYNESTSSPPIAIEPLVSTGTWDVSHWDADYWGRTPYNQQKIVAYSDFGVVASHWLTGSFNGHSFEWFSTEHVYEEASGLL